MLNAPLIVLHKRRESGTAVEVTHVVGDVSGRACVIVDDMISTGSTVAESIRALLVAGARWEIVVAATHGLLLPGARTKLDSFAVREVLVTDTMETGPNCTSYRSRLWSPPAHWSASWQMGRFATCMRSRH